MLICRSRNKDQDLMSPMSQWLVALKSESVAGCVVHEEWQSVCPVRLDRGSAMVQ